MRRVLEMLASDPEITSVSFRAPSFWGSPGIEVQGWALQRGLRDYDRLYKWGPGYRYVTHEPPTVTDELHRDWRGRHRRQPLRCQHCARDKRTQLKDMPSWRTVAYAAWIREPRCLA